MHVNILWKFHQNVFTLTITFIVLNVYTEFVLIYRPHPVLIGWNLATPPPPAFGLIYEGAIVQPW